MKLSSKEIMLGGILGLVPAYMHAGDVRPNVMLIYIDDLGYSDVSCYGRLHGDILVETPNIDRLASSGVMFTSAYSAAPISTAARAGLLTGLYPSRLGIEFVTSYEKKAVSWHSEEWRKKFEGKKLLPPPLTLTLPLESVTLAEDLRDNGYETAIVGKWHLSAHNKVYNGWNKQYGPDRRGFQWSADTFGCFGSKSETKESPAYPYDELTERAVDFLQQEHEKPFFLYVSHYLVHTPYKVQSEEILSKYRQKHPDWSEEKIRYAVYVDRMDYYVGRLTDALKQSEYADNTIVIFASDNGGHPEFSLNKPFRGSKWNLYEGGVRVPMIISYPGLFAPAVSDAMVTQLDLFPTIMDIAGGTPSRKIDGESILDILQGKSHGSQNRTMIWHFPYYHPEGDAYYKAIDEIGVDDRKVSKTKPQSAMRKGKYKLIYFYEDDSVELYDLSKDISERHDLAKSRPAIARRMKKELLNTLMSANARFPEVQDAK